MAKIGWLGGLFYEYDTRKFGCLLLCHKRWVHYFCPRKKRQLTLPECSWEQYLVGAAFLHDLLRDDPKNVVKILTDFVGGSHPFGIQAFHRFNKKEWPFLLR